MTVTTVLVHLLTGAFLAGVGQVIVAGHIAPASIIVPHHHHTVFSREEIAVWLPPVPVLIQLQTRRERGFKLIDLFACKEITTLTYSIEIHCKICFR